jgi:hypothetical protein
MTTARTERARDPQKPAQPIIAVRISIANSFAEKKEGDSKLCRHKPTADQTKSITSVQIVHILTFCCLLLLKSDWQE